VVSFEHGAEPLEFLSSCIIDSFSRSAQLHVVRNLQQSSHMSNKLRSDRRGIYIVHMAGEMEIYTTFRSGNHKRTGQLKDLSINGWTIKEHLRATEC
jgi:flagellar basal body rod protein FlgG